MTHYLIMGLFIAVVYLSVVVNNLVYRVTQLEKERKNRG